MRSYLDMNQVENECMNVNVITTVNELIRALSLAMDIEQRGKRYHGWRTAVIASILSQDMNDEKRRVMFYASMLHDIGGVGQLHEPLHDFLYPDKEKQPGIFSHSLMSANIIEKIPGLEMIKQPIVEHHERWNGSGYPYKLHGDELSFTGQIIQAADYIDILMRSGVISSRDALYTHINKTRGNLFSLMMSDHICDSFSNITPEQCEGIRQLDLLPEYYSLMCDMTGPLMVLEDIDVIEVVLDVFADVIDAKHPYTSGHTRRVAHYAAQIGRAMGWDDQTLRELRWAGLLHDVGKLCVPIDILDKPAHLTDKEYQKTRHHAHYTFDIINMISTLAHIALPAAAHHERLDGKGYPFGLQANEIPPVARVLCVADAFDALTSGRNYVIDMDREKIVSIFETNAGTQFDPEIVTIGLPILLEEKFGRTKNFESALLIHIASD